MKLVFFGSGAFGLPTVRSLIEEHDLLAIVTQPDRPAGRGGKLRPTPIGEWAASEAPGIPYLKPERVNEPEIRDRIRSLGADAWVVIAFGQKLGPKLLDGVFAINLHASLLPRWRGAAPIHHAIMAGDTETGNSVITLADEMDAGEILGQSTRAIGGSETTGDLHDILAEDGPALVESVLRQHAEGTTTARKQDPDRVTLAPKLSRADASLDWMAAADALRATINGLSPWPGCEATVSGHTIKLLRSRAVTTPADAAAPGTLIDAAHGVVACGVGAIELLEVQPRGGRVMSFGDFARGRAVADGAMVRADGQAGGAVL